MTEPITWSVYDEISIDEKIRRTKRALKLLSACSGPISQSMAQNKRLLLAELERSREIPTMPVTPAERGSHGTGTGFP